MIFGYARVSTHEQNLEMQIDVLKEYGVDEIREEKISGSSKNRPVFEDLRKKLRNGDTVVVYKLDRLGRTVKQLIIQIDEFEQKGINFVSLHENIDTTTPTGRFIFTIFCALAEMERDLIVSRTRDGLIAARARGRVGGRPKADEKKINMAIQMYDAGIPISDILKASSICKTTLYKYVRNKKSAEFPTAVIKRRHGL